MKSVAEKTQSRKLTAPQRSLLHSLRPMEAKGCSPRWKMHLPEFKHSRRCLDLTTKGGELSKTEREKGRGGAHKSVSLLPTSRYLTDRQYVMRKPLFSAEQHTSILKKTQSQEHTRTEKHPSISRRNQTNMNVSTRRREELTAQSLSRSLRDVSPPSASSEDLGSPLGVSELRGRLDREEPSVGSPLYAARSTQRSLFSSILEVQRLNPPQRPRLTSTVLNPTYTPRSGHPRPGRMEEENRPSSFGKHSKSDSMSPYQAKYWACAIPKTSPPSPDRRSARWDPNREYQALLDYTYPLRPGGAVSEWDSSELQDDCLRQTHLQDSGIELDHLCSSTSLSLLDLSLNGGTGQARERSPADVGDGSPDLPLGFAGSSDGLPSGTRFSLPEPVGLSLGSLDCSLDRGGPDHYQSGDDRLQRGARAPSSTSTSTAFIHSTCLFPQPRRVCGEVDEEFRPLPEQLEELQQLSRQVREVTAKLTRPVTASWESLEPGNDSVLSSVTLPEKQEAEDEDKEDESQDTDGGKHETVREESTLQTAAHRDSEAVRRVSGALVEPVEAGLSRSSLREVEALVEQLRGLTLPGNQRGNQQDRELSDSLMQHIQVFCSHLERLIQQLYTVSEKMEILAAPTADIDSVKSSLAEYQSFQRAVSGHQPLASCVLHTGHLLLSCINTTSPLLRDTLQLIERQSGALQTYTERLFSSILSAMDSLTQPSLPGPVRQSREEEPDPAGLQGSAL